MEKLVRQILFIPVVSLVLTIILFVSFYAVLLDKVATKKFEEEKNQLIKLKKEELKNQVDAVIMAFDEIREVSYKVASSKNKQELDKKIKEAIFKFLDNFNRGKISYIAIGHIDTFHPKADGIFGKIVYMPPPLRNKIGKPLGINKPDPRGKYFRKEYFECLKAGKRCFIQYSYINPKTKKVEEKISYFAYYKPYSWSVVKGIYLSQIQNQIDKSKEYIFKRVKKVFIAAILILLLFSSISIFLAYILSKKILNRILKDYKKLEISYQEINLELLKKYKFDELTKLPNRNALLNDLKNYKALILIDIDNFSTINDVYGFDKGNEILQQIANDLKKIYNYVYRIGSDEFAIGFKNEINEKLLKTISKTTFEVSIISINITAGGSNTQNLLETADIALQCALRRKSRNYCLYDEQIKLLQENKLEDMKLLRRVIKNESVEAFYQCIVDRDKNVIKYEALMRLYDNGEIYSPYFYLELAKEIKIYSKLSQIMIEKVFSNLEKFDKKVSINLSFDDIVNEETKNLIFAKLNSGNAKKIVFEILESESIENFEVVKDFIKYVKKFGAKIAIDDFGSGYSNLIRVLDLEPDYIKIDSSLIKSLEKEEYREIVKLLIEFSKKFGKVVTAEFVSDENKFKTLMELGVDEFQGFYFCKPMPLEDLKR